MFTTAITQAEMLSGIEALPMGKRRAALLENVERMFVERFDGKVLPFDDSAARLFGKITATRNSIGRPISQFDAMIAAIARARHFTVATRDIAGFQHCGVRVIDPWAYRA